MVEVSNATYTANINVLRRDIRDLKYIMMSKSLTEVRPFRKGKSSDMTGECAYKFHQLLYLFISKRCDSRVYNVTVPTFFSSIFSEEHDAANVARSLTACLGSGLIFDKHS
jgi:hypothetical protein